MPSTLVILGAVGDLTSRYLLPALAELGERNELPSDLAVIGVARHSLSTAEYHDRLRADADESDRLEPVLDRLSYARADATEADDLGSLPVPDEGPVIFYMALPPAIFADTFQAIAETDLRSRVRLAIEKPFGQDQNSARELNEVLDRCIDADRVFRVDHFLGLSLARRLPDIRQGPILRSVWTAEHIESVDVVWDETIALEGRAGYYDETGALRDMLQNHLLQLLTVVAMEPPSKLGADAIPRSRLDLLEHVHVVPERSRRGRYSSGTVDGEAVAAYTDEDEVGADRGTETFAEIELAIDCPRWRGVTVRLRSGKALVSDRRCIVVRFRDSTDELVFGLEPGSIAARIGGLSFSAELPTDDPSPYAQVLADLFAGDQRWFVSAAEAEEQWRIVEPVLERWADGEPPIVEYPAGSAGPG